MALRTPAGALGARSATVSQGAPRGLCAAVAVRRRRGCARAAVAVLDESKLAPELRSNFRPVDPSQVGYDIEARCTRPPA